MKGHYVKTYTCLGEVLLLEKDAHVLLCKNVNVTDGLVSGVCGTVTDIVYAGHERKFPQTVYVKFDNSEGGVEGNTVIIF